MPTLSEGPMEHAEIMTEGSTCGHNRVTREKTTSVSSLAKGRKAATDVKVVAANGPLALDTGGQTWPLTREGGGALMIKVRAPGLLPAPDGTAGPAA